VPVHHDLIDAHLGRPAVILGGGASLAEHLQNAPAGAVRISCNLHGLAHGRCDYVAALDVTMQEALRSCAVPTITPHEWSTHRIRGAFNYTGQYAAWCAWLMGCAPVVLAGMDCSSGQSQAWHVETWREALGRFPKVTRCLAGPLAYLMRRYSAQEHLPQAQRIWIRRRGEPLYERLPSKAAKALLAAGEAHFFREDPHEDVQDPDARDAHRRSLSPHAGPAAPARAPGAADR
jgi:hypothetical protein